MRQDQIQSRTLWGTYRYRKSLWDIEERVKRIEAKLGISFDEVSRNEDITGTGAAAVPSRQSQNEQEVSDVGVDVEGMRFETAIIGPNESKPEQELVEEDDGDMADNVCWAYRLLHMPTLRRQVLETYQQIGAGQMPNLPVLALVCAVFALAKYFSLSTSAFQTSDTSRDKPHQEYVEMSSRALAEAGHLENPTLESIQAVLLVGTCLLGNTGAIRSSRVLAAAMYISAQALSLHQVDSPKNKRLRQKGPYNKLELELKRRIWWHIASTDWVFAFISGPQTGTYMVHPHQMNVNLPSNADDNEITPSSCPDRPLTEPSEMTYFILRCKLGILFLEFMETANRDGTGIDEIEYDQVLAFDKKVSTFLETLPYFLREETEGNNECSIELEKSRRELDEERPYLKWQRVMAQFGACTRISRLHRRYLALGARDPRYAYSRMVCLRSARVVLEVERRMRENIGPSSPDPSKVWAIAYQVFLATTVLAMDYHFNRNEPRAEERAQEILDCCRTLEAAAGNSIVAARGLKKLREVTAKWGLLTGPDPRSNNQTGKEPLSVPTDPSPVKFRGYTQDESTLDRMDGGNPGASWVDSWDFNAVLDYSQWDGVFQDLETTP
ncbi:hypothetical protein FQN49_003841, partial [Arthroderma sp. PD_2]